MKYLVVEPHDSVIIRDGRPFSTVAGVAKAHSLPFVTPSVISGAFRSRLATNVDGDYIGVGTDVESLQNISVRGPILMRRTIENNVNWTPFCARPADAVAFDDSPRWFRVKPQNQGSMGTDLSAHKLFPLYLPDDAPDAKVTISAPFWSISMIREWLNGTLLMRSDTRINEISELPRDYRYHVKIDNAKGTAETGKLFATNAIGFRKRSQGNNTEQLAVLVIVDDSQNIRLDCDTQDQTVAQKLLIPPVIDTLGGEQRMVRWHNIDSIQVNDSAYLETPPSMIVESVKNTLNCRVLLTTPAYIEDITTPQYLCAESHGVTAKVISVALPRAEWNSGWDMHSNQPKKSRRLAPAGTVFFLELQVNSDNLATAVAKWISDKWMNSISDDAQMRRDGAGLVLIGCGW
jgi:CRISPR-associated protein Cmr3